LVGGSPVNQNGPLMNSCPADGPADLAVEPEMRIESS
jgi:hypothetical protein